jgi:signal transduction histidine kinase
MRILHLIIFCLLCGWIFPVKAQYGNSALLTADKTDTTYILQLLSTGKAIEPSNMDSALLFYKRALDLSEKANYAKGIYKACQYAAFMLSNQAQFDEAVLLLDKYLALAINKGDAQEEAKAYIEYGTHFSYRGDRQQQVVYYKKAMPLLTRLNDTASLSKLYGNLSATFSQRKLPSEAFRYGFMALAIDRLNNNLIYIASDYNNLANIHLALKNGDSAKYYFLQALKIARSTHNSMLEVVPLVNLANLLKDKQPDTAVVLSQQAVLLSRQMQFVTGIIRSTMELARCNTAAGNHIEAIKLLKGLRLDYPEQMGLEENILILEALYDSYKGSKNYQEAINVNDEWLVLNDSAQNEATRQGLLDLSKQVENLSHEKKLLVKESYISKQKNQITWLITGLASMLICGILFLQYHRARQQAKNKTIETLQKEKELVKVNVQLEGLIKERERISKEIHDEMGASLTSISLLTQVLQKKNGIGEQPELKKIADTSGEMVRQLNEIIWSLNAANDTVNSLMAYLRHFASNFLAEHGIALQYDDMPLKEDKVLEGIIRQHIFLTAKEAIHNIVRHSGATEAGITVSTQNGLKIDIRDNGKGIDFNNLPPFRNGIANMRERMESIGGKLMIENNGGTFVSIIYQGLPQA